MTNLGLHKIAAAHVLYLVLAGAGISIALRRASVDLSLWDLAICALPSLLALVLAFTSTEDAEQYVLRLAAAAMFVPILLLFWSQEQGLPTAQMLGAGLAHLLCFAGAVLYLGTKTTKVAPAAGVTAVDAQTLHARLLSLGETSAPLQATSPAANEVVVVFRYRSPGRSYRLLLNLDPASHFVRVRERASANMTAPVKESDKSMRGLGQPSFDAARPDAQAVSETVAQVTPIRKAQLQATPLTFLGRAVSVPAEFADSLDERGVATLLCAVVTRSGWHWRPAFFGAK